MSRIVLKYLTGPRAGESEGLEVEPRSEIVLAQAAVALWSPDSRKEQPVGRWLARIIPVGAQLRHFVLVDLEGRAGIFINRRRIRDATLIRPGDVLQLGEGGPEIEFTVVTPP